MLLPPLDALGKTLTFLVLIASLVGVILPIVRGRNLSLSLAAANIAVAVLLLVAQAALPREMVSWRYGWGLVSIGFAPASLSSYPGLGYTLLTSQFVHLTLFHLGFNMVMLLLWGPSLEARLGTRRMAVLYLTTGVAAALLFSAIYAVLPVGVAGAGILLGASGAINGLLGGYARLWPDERIRLFVGIGLLPPMRMATLWAGLLILETALGLLDLAGVRILLLGPDRVAHFAHVSGLLVGFAMAPAILMIRERREPHRTRYDPTPLHILATTPRLREIFDQARKAEEPEVAAAWRTSLIEQARCPRCGGGLREGRSSVDCVDRGCAFRLALVTPSLTGLSSHR